MIPRLDISFPVRRQWQFWFGKDYIPSENEFLLNNARSGIVLALKTICVGAKVGVVAYNCHTVANAVVNAGCVPIFIDVTNQLTIDINDPNIALCDALIVTNLFGIHNDIKAIKGLYPNIIIVVDNAHGYGLPNDGDFTVYSINQGKYPALGPGGILFVNNQRYLPQIKNVVQQLDHKMSYCRQIKVFLLMQFKALLYRPLIYSLITRKIKRHRGVGSNISKIDVKLMCPGVSKIYNAWKIEHRGQNCKLFMDVVHTNNVQHIIEEYSRKGIEVDTHFKNCIVWAREFGYKDGSCPNSERLVNELVMIPNYFKYERMD